MVLFGGDRNNVSEYRAQQIVDHNLANHLERGMATKHSQGDGTQNSGNGGCEPQSEELVLFALHELQVRSGRGLDLAVNLQFEIDDAPSE